MDFHLKSFCTIIDQKWELLNCGNIDQLKVFISRLWLEWVLGYIELVGASIQWNQPNQMKHCQSNSICRVNLSIWKLFTEFMTDLNFITLKTFQLNLNSVSFNFNKIFKSTSRPRRPFEYLNIWNNETTNFCLSPLNILHIAHLASPIVVLTSWRWKCESELPGLACQILWRDSQ